MDILTKFLPSAIIDHVLLGYLDNKQFFLLCQRKEKYVNQFIERTQNIFYHNYGEFLKVCSWQSRETLQPFELTVYGVRLPFHSQRMKEDNHYSWIAREFFMKPTYEKMIMEKDRSNTMENLGTKDIIEVELRTMIFKTTWFEVHIVNGYCKCGCGDTDGLWEEIDGIHYAEYEKKQQEDVERIHKEMQARYY